MNYSAIFTAAHFHWLTALITTALLLSGPQPTHAQLLQWEVTGQVLELLDPDSTYYGPEGLLGDVRVGDPVRGTIYYDLQLPPDNDPIEGTFYESEASLTGPVLVVENPRDQTELAFAASAENAGSFPYFVDVYNDYFDDFLGETIDELYVDYTVDPPFEFQGFVQTVSYYLGGQDPIDDETLPTELSSNDWPIGEISFMDLDIDFDTFEPIPYAGFFAEIHSIELVEPATKPGDFNVDESVDGQDFLVWQRGESPSRLSAADLGEWKANYGAAASFSANSAQVPEPSTWLMLTMGMAAILAYLRSPVSNLVCL